MQSPMFWILAAVVAVALANYGVPPANPPAPVYQPQIPTYPGVPVYPWPGHHGHHHRRHRHSSEDSDSDESREHRCRSCKKLSVLKSDKLKEMELNKPSIEYISNKGCSRALISCPEDGAFWYLITENKDGFQFFTTGTHVQRMVKCNKKGKYESIVTDNKEKISFTKVVCVKENAGARAAKNGTAPFPLH